MIPFTDALARQCLKQAYLRRNCIGLLADRLEEIGDTERAEMARLWLSRVNGRRCADPHRRQLLESATRVPTDWLGILDWVGRKGKPCRRCILDSQTSEVPFGVLDVKKLIGGRTDPWLRVGELHDGRFFSLYARPQGADYEENYLELEFEEAYVADTEDDILLHGIREQDYEAMFHVQRLYPVTFQVKVANPRPFVVMRQDP